jgi:hypothetical protein
MNLQGSVSRLNPTPVKIDYASLYERIGDIVIERAHAGDKQCQEIYEHAWNRTNFFYIKINSATGNMGNESKIPAADGAGVNGTSNGIRRFDK